MNQTVLSQLQSVEAELAAQENQLAEQLAEVQEKLSGLRSVMPMFSDVPDSASKPAAVPVVDKSESKPAKVAVSKQKTQQKKTNQPKVSKKKSASKKDGRTATWQKYTRPGVKNESIPDAVKLILETQPEHEFKIAEVMGALFKENMPKAQYIKARNRISNVLSGGVRAGDWYKGQRGSYRITKAG